MKKLLLLLTILISIEVSAQKYQNNVNDHKAIPLPYDGLDLFFFSFPEDMFYKLGDVIIENPFGMTDEEKIKQLVQICKKKYKNADGLLFIGFTKDKAEAIKFKTLTP